jgi:hypothetical protein
MRAIFGALSVQLSRDIAPIHGGGLAIELPAPGRKPQGNAIMTGLDAPTVPGAAGFHDETVKGQKRGFVFTNPTLDNGGTILRGSNSVSVTYSHEMVEMIGDGPCNRWADGPANADGVALDYAIELADPVEGDSYDIDGVAVSNFVYPAWFDEHAPPGSRFDHLGKLTAPFTMTPGGYMITRTETGEESQVFAAGIRGHHVGDGVHVHFGQDFPEWRREAVIARARARRCPRT